MIVVIAHYRTSPDRVAEVRAVLADHSRASENEPGCISFSVHQDSEDPARFALFEAYEDEEAFQAHRRSRHFRDNITDKVAPLLLERTWRRYGPRL